MTSSKKAVCLFSGGLDSSTVLYEAQSQGYEVIALTIHYGQMHAREIQSAEQIVKSLNIKQYTIPIQLPWGGSALLDSAVELPKGREESEMSQDIPATYVPARNSIFLSLASSLAEAESAETIFIGANVLDYSGYPDCRPEYLSAFTEMINRGTKLGQDGKGFEIKAPLLKLNKKEIIELGMKLGVPYEKTWSCYQGGDVPCGECDSCILRAKGFREAGYDDPLLVKEGEVR